MRFFVLLHHDRDELAKLIVHLGRVLERTEMAGVPDQLELHNVVLSVRLHFAQIDLVLANGEAKRHFVAHWHFADVIRTAERMVSELFVVARGVSTILGDPEDLRE